MSNFVYIIKQCENANGAGTKKIIFDALASCDDIALRLIKEALDPYRIFGVKKFNMPKIFNVTNNRYLEFFNLLDKLHNRELTGNAAKNSITNVLSNFSNEEAIYISRVISKDLKAGFSGDTVNKIFKNAIPTFSVMLADKFDTDEEVKSNVMFPCLAEAKYDGERTIAIVTQNSVTYYSRSGKEAIHVNGLFDDECLRVRNVLGEDIVIDGERYATNFTETMNSKKEGNSEAKQNLRFYVFFIMRLREWRAEECMFKMFEARHISEETLKLANCEKIKLSKGILVQNFDEAEKFYKEMVAEGFEGLILKQLIANYEWDRSKNWVKWKPFFDFDGKIIGFYEGRNGTRLENQLGGIIIEGVDEHGRQVEANVGSGFSDSLRKEIWHNQSNFLGKTVTVKYQEISKSQNSEKYSLRFPTFERFRDDK